MLLIIKIIIVIIRGGFRGGADAPPPSGIRPPVDPKGPPFDTFSEIQFLPTDPKIFLKAPWAPIYTKFEGKRAPKKKRDFFVNIFQKVPKNGLFDCFFFKICLRRRKFTHNRGKTVLWESSKSQFGRPNKKVVKILENFLKIRPPPPRENPRSAPGYNNINNHNKKFFFETA